MIKSSCTNITSLLRVQRQSALLSSRSNSLQHKLPQSQTRLFFSSPENSPRQAKGLFSNIILHGLIPVTRILASYISSAASLASSREIMLVDQDGNLTAMGILSLGRGVTEWRSCRGRSVNGRRYLTMFLGKVCTMPLLGGETGRRICRLRRLRCGLSCEREA